MSVRGGAAAYARLRNVHASAWIAPSAQLYGKLEIGPDVSIWHNAVLHLGTQTLFRHFWQVVQVLTQTPWPLQVWHGPHLLLQTPLTHTWHCAVLQQLAPQVVVPAAQAEQTPLTQLPEEQSEPCVHCAPGFSVPGRKQALRRSVPAAWGSRQMGWMPLAVLQQSVSRVQR